MSTLLEEAVEAVRHLPASEQDEIARAILRLSGLADGAAIELNKDEQAAIDRSKAAAERGDFATDAEISAVWAKRGL